MSLVFFSGRLPIRKLLKYAVPLHAVEHLATQFDMFQALETSEEDAAAACVLLEHLLRPLLLAEEFQFLNSHLTPELQGLVERCGEVAEARSPFDVLAANAQTALIRPAASVPQVLKVYFLEKGRLVYQQTAGDNTQPIPKSHLLKLDRVYAILYTPTTTFIDGFDPNSGEHRPSLLPSLLLKKARASVISFSQKRNKRVVVGEETLDFSAEANHPEELPRGLGVFSMSDFQSLLEESPGPKREHHEVIQTESQLPSEIVPAQRSVAEANQQSCCSYNCQLF